MFTMTIVSYFHAGEYQGFKTKSSSIFYMISTYTNDKNFAHISRYMTNGAVILYAATQFFIFLLLLLLLFLRNHFPYLVPILLQAWYLQVYGSNECISKFRSTIRRHAAP